MSPRPENFTGPRFRILIVDDVSDAARTTGLWLKFYGHETEVLTDPTQWLSRLECFEPDVVLLDIGMPIISGYDIATQIRLQPRFDSLAIIAISGYANESHTRRSSIIAGCDKHLAKPVDLGTLEAIIIQAVQDRIERRATGPTAFERGAIQKRLDQLAVALGHPGRTEKQSDALKLE